MNDETFETLCVKLTRQDEDYFKQITSSFEPEFFNNRTIGEVIKFSGEYFQQYNQIPPVEYLKSVVSIKEDLDDLISDMDTTDFDFTTHREWFLDKSNEYLKSQSIKEGIIQSVDIINNNGDIYKIRDLINQSLEKDLNPKTKDIEVLGVFDFINKPRPPREIMIDPWLMENQYIVVSGERGIGKSMFCLSLCIHLSMGTRFYTWTPTKRYKTLYIDGEMTSHDTIDRLKTFNIEGYPDLGEYFYIYSLLDQDTTIQPHLTDKRFRNKVEDICIKFGIQLVVFDNKSSFTPGIEENNKGGYDDINQWFVSLRSKKINPLIVCHKGKNTKGPRGTSGIEDNNDISIELTRPSDYNRSSGCSFNMKFTKMRNYIENQIMFYKLSYMKNNEDDYFHWEGKDTSLENQDMFICLGLSDGIPPKSLVEKYHIVKSTISKRKRFFIEKGYIDENHKLTDKGRLWTCDVEELYYEIEKPELLRGVETESET